MSCSRRPWRNARGDPDVDVALVHAGRGVEDGDRRQRAIARPVWKAESVRRRLGVEEGALRTLLVDGNPLDDLTLVENPGKNFVVIMKDGKVHKNLLTAGR